MNYLLALALVGLLLVVIHFSTNGKLDLPSFLPGGEKKAAPQQVEPETGAAENAPVEPGAASIDMGEETYGQMQVPGGVYQIPMGGQNLGYPSEMLPSSVAKFHPTNDCDRFLCQGCSTCSTVGGCGPMTDDRGRNYPELIDRIRSARTNEYPFYNLN